MIRCKDKSAPPVIDTYRCSSQRVDKHEGVIVAISSWCEYIGNERIDIGIGEFNLILQIATGGFINELINSRFCYHQYSVATGVLVIFPPDQRCSMDVRKCVA